MPFVERLRRRLAAQLLFDHSASMSPTFRPYRDLSRASTLFDRIPLTARTTKKINVLVPDVDPRRTFAGVKTALALGAKLGRELELPVRIMAMQRWGGGSRRSASDILTSLGLPVKEQPIELLSIAEVTEVGVGENDLWLATFWTTAHALDVACRVGLVPRESVAYFIQDYEPAFQGWSTEYVLAKSTYHAGFLHLYNSKPLADYVTHVESLDLDIGRVIGPDLDLGRLKEVAEQRAVEASSKVFFYSRPGRPRNMYNLGVSALRVASQIAVSRDTPFDVISAGQVHDPIRLADGSLVKQMGKTSYDQYYGLLGRVSVGLSLMCSPHPSHPPLDLAVSGAHAVTNRLEAYRQGLHPRLHAVEATPEALAGGLVRALDRVAREGFGNYLPPNEGALGGSMDVAARNVARFWGH